MENPIVFIIPHIFFIVKGLKRNKMKICAIICEYNPFHNGHAYQIAEAKRLSGADAVLCLMSGNFVQRGEAAILEKRTRAKHAVLCGADAVLELPTVFACSNAEIFAKGAVSLLSKIPAVSVLSFGAENADAEEFKRIATLTNDEPKSVSLRIKELTSQGISYAKARAKAWNEHTETPLLSSPNNILGVEYTRAIFNAGAAIDILPIPRRGNGYHDTTADGEFPSASAVREAVRNDTLPAVKDGIPEAVSLDLPKTTENSLALMEKTAILLTDKSILKRTLDCTEGLENAFLQAVECGIEDFIGELTSARYTASRLRRIALHNLLNIREDFIRKCLSSPLYLAPLAYRKDRTDLLKALSEAEIPFLSSGKQVKALSSTARECYEKDEFAARIYALATNTRNEEKPFIL